MRIVALVAAAALVGAFSVSGEDKKQTNSATSNDSNQQRSPSHADGNWKNSDHCFATCVAYGNQIEIATSRIASQKAQNAEVKKFAEMMLQDHQKFLSKLEKFAPDAARNDSLANSTGSRNETAVTRPDNQSPIQQTRANDDKDNKSVRTADNRTESGHDSHHAMKLAQIEREMAEQCLASARRKLESKNGAEFDKCFIHSQIAAHEHMKDKLTVLKRHASEELSPILSEGLKTTEQHLAKAEEIAKSLEHASNK